MPELPEVEIIKRQLTDKITGLKVTNVDVLSGKSFQGEKNEIIGAKITGLKRIGKMLTIAFNNRLNLLVHFKLTGQLIYESPDKASHLIGGHPVPFADTALPAKSTRVIFYFDNNGKLFFNDIRKFGWIKIVKTYEFPRLKIIKKQGLEPFSSDFTLEKFQDMLLKWGRPVKLLLMEQSKISGVGNIYANEALFCAGIAPHHRGRDLIKDHSEKIKKLYGCLKEVLEKGLKYGGTSDNAYVDAFGKKGKMQEHLKVYGKTGKPCPNNCGGIIRRMVLGGRGTFFCPKCQR